jgi:hypothetical protein
LSRSRAVSRVPSATMPLLWTNEKSLAILIACSARYRATKGTDREELISQTVQVIKRDAGYKKLPDNLYGVL